MNMGLRLLGAGSMGMMGSFIGFTIGGAAASMEVERNMADAPRFVLSPFVSEAMASSPAGIVTDSAVLGRWSRESRC